MQKTTLFSLLLTLGNLMCCIAQFSVVNTQKYGGPGNDGFRVVKPAADGGFIMAGISSIVGADVTENGGCSDFWIVKTDSGGNLLWQKSLHVDCDFVRDVLATSDGGYILAGATEIETVFLPLVIKLDSDLEIQWQYMPDDFELSVTCTHVHETSDGSFLVSGWASDLFSFTQGILLKLDSTGTPVLEEFREAHRGTRLHASSGGNFIVIEEVYLGEGIYAPLFTKIDEDGNSIWNENYPEIAFHFVHSLASTSDGGFIAASNNNLSSNASNMLNLTKFDSDGNFQWTQENEAALANESISFIAETPNGGFIGSGSEGLNDIDIYIFQADQNGTITADASFGGTGMDFGNSAVLNDNILHIAGISNSANGDFEPGNGQDDAFLMKLDVTLNSTHFQREKIKIWPNPATSVLNIDIDDVTARIAICDVMGKTLRTDMTAGSIDVSDLRSGVYFLEISSETGRRIATFVKI